MFSKILFISLCVTLNTALSSVYLNKKKRYGLFSVFSKTWVWQCDRCRQRDTISNSSKHDLFTLDCTLNTDHHNVKPSQLSHGTAVNDASSHEAFRGLSPVDVQMLLWNGTSFACFYVNMAKRRSLHCDNHLQVFQSLSCWIWRVEQVKGTLHFFWK